MSDGTLGHSIGTAMPNTGSAWNGTVFSFPSRAAVIIARVYFNFIRFPMPYGPPVQPVLIIHTFTLCSCILSPSILAYLPGCSGRKGAPKQALNVGLGSVTPASVPATFAV